MSQIMKNDYGNYGKNTIKSHKNTIKSICKR